MQLKSFFTNISSYLPLVLVCLATSCKERVQNAEIKSATMNLKCTGTGTMLVDNVKTKLNIKIYRDEKYCDKDAPDEICGDRYIRTLYRPESNFSSSLKSGGFAMHRLKNSGNTLTTTGYEEQMVPTIMQTVDGSLNINSTSLAGTWTEVEKKTSGVTGSYTHTSEFNIKCTR